MSSGTESIAVVICAAGVSKRMGGLKKEYQKIDNSAPQNAQSLTVLGSSVRAFSLIDNIDIIAVAHPKNEEKDARSSLPEEIISSSKFKLVFCEGGATRQESVYNALRALSDFNPGFVLIHDGARPFISASLINNVITAVKNHGAAIPLLPLTETPKEFKNGFVTRHLKRADTGAAQTPQGFKFAEILQAHEKAAIESEEFTDDAEIWGRFIGEVAVVPGEPENRKITFKEDLI